MPKTLILMRHGHVVADTDSLTDLGIRQVQDVARQMFDAGIVPDLILRSVAGRTRQTAEVIVKAYEEAGHEILKEQVHESRHLKGDHYSILDVLDAFSDSQVALAISHAPDIDRALESLTGSNKNLIHLAQATVIKGPADKSWGEFINPRSLPNRETRIFRSDIRAPLEQLLR